MARVTVIIVNGQPGAGKDSLIEMMNLQLKNNRLLVMQHSSIDIVRHNLHHFNVDIDGKTQADRDLLSNIGDLLEAHSNVRSNECNEKIWECVKGVRPAVLFLHIREPAMIKKVMDAFINQSGVTFVRVQVVSDRALDIQSNASDANTHLMDYDITVNNSGTRGALYDEATNVIRYCALLDFLK